MNIAVIGGGASGLMAAIAAARCGAYVTVYEKHDRIGKKLLATGNGRCNLTNTEASEADYHGNDTSIISRVSEEFWTDETMNFFSEIGLLLKTESDGKVYPYSDRASSVLDVLRGELSRLGIQLQCGFDAAEVIKRADAFEIVSYDDRHFFADKVIFAAGGKASPSLCGGNGYDILKCLGHSITPLSPAIVQLKADNKNLKGLKGVKCHAKLTLRDVSCTGELLFTDIGLSGPPSFYLSSYLNRNKTDTVYIDFFDGYDKKDLFKMLSNSTELFHTKEDLFSGLLHKRIGIAILKQCGIDNLPGRCSDLSRRELDLIAQTSKMFSVQIIGTESWNNAQVTSGGIPISEIDTDSFMSKKCQDLYITGEILDIDGNCGGFNLQWAWSTGYLAGTHAACNL